ncbi:unnamed protein product [Prunus armeniaca]
MDLQILASSSIQRQFYQPSLCRSALLRNSLCRVTLSLSPTQSSSSLSHPSLTPRVEEYHVYRRTRKMASSVKAEGCKKELSFSSCNNCKGFSIFRVGTMKRMCCVCLNKGKDHPSTVETTDKFELHTNLCVSILKVYGRKGLHNHKMGKQEFSKNLGAAIATRGAFLWMTRPVHSVMLISSALAPPGNVQSNLCTRFANTISLVIMANKDPGLIQNF